MPVKRYRHFSDIVSDPEAVTVLACLPHSAPGRTLAELVACVREAGLLITRDRLTRILFRCREYGASIPVHRRNANRRRQRRVTLYWMPEPAQLETISATFTG